MEKCDNILYACDPDLNVSCSPRLKKELCQNGGRYQLCEGTFDVRFARQDKSGNPITLKQWKNMKEETKNDP